MGSVCVSSCRCCVFLSVVHPVAILIAVFCVICSLLMFVSDASGDHMVEHQTDTACVWLVCHSKEGLCKLYPPYPASSEARTPSFFLSLRETLSPIQDQNQH